MKKIIIQLISDTEYQLVMQNDSLTRGNTQWFYFRVSNTFAGSAKFHIINFCKSDSLYTRGMKIAVRSQKSSQKDWYRAGENIQYGYRALASRQNRKYYVLSFDFFFKHEKDVVDFAFAVPYTYSDLLSVIGSFTNNILLSRRTFCTTIAGYSCEVLTITSRPKQGNRAVVLTARAHPGETVGSHMLSGALRFLLSADPEAELLRRQFIFKIVPMLNIDGVIQGNYRCSLSGCDLNRRYTNTSKFLHPTVYYLIKMVRELNKDTQIAFYCDFHGHSKNKNVFMYGNSEPDLGKEYCFCPWIMSKLNPFFSYSACRFGVQKSKASTARISMWRELHIPAVYTIEASFLGPSIETHTDQAHFSLAQLEEIGKHLCQTLITYSKYKQKKYF